MTVAELIEKLQEMPQEKPVYAYVYGEEKEVDRVIESDAFGLIGSVEIM